MSFSAFRKTPLFRRLKLIALPILRPFFKTRIKRWAEFTYWKEQWAKEGGTFANDHYQPLMLAIAGENDAEFLRDKIVADFGCGPRGSLCWAREARQRIGIDVLIDQYAKLGISQHDMVYVRNTERQIPLPDSYVDVMFVINALDHCSDLKNSCREILRVMKPDALLIGSFGLEEEMSAAEPTTLTMKKLNRHLLDKLRIERMILAPKGPDGDTYIHMKNPPETIPDGPRILWVRATKP